SASAVLPPVRRRWPGFASFSSSCSSRPAWSTGCSVAASPRLRCVSPTTNATQPPVPLPGPLPHRNGPGHSSEKEEHLTLPALAPPLRTRPAGDALWPPPSPRQPREWAEPPPPPFTLPRTLAEDETGSFSIGPEGGYLRARDADRGTWFAGAKARLHVLHFLAAEASITFHQNRYESGDIVVTQYPVQLTAFLYILPVGPVRPYILGGVGWYYTRIDHKGNLSFIEDQTEHFFGVHLGAGAEIMLGTHTSLDADVRYIFINATTQQVLDDRNFQYWQITFGLNLYF